MTDTNLHSVVVVAVDPTRLSFPSDDESGLRLLRIPVVDSTTPATVFDEVVRSGAKAVCVDADVCESLALDLSKLLDETWPEIGVVLVRDPSPTLWASAARVGIRDIVAPDSSLDELLASLLTVVDRGERVSGTRSAADSPDRRRGRVIVVLSPKGGSGKTMVATNLAVSLSASNSGDTVLVDLDAVFGDVASVMGLVPDHTIGQLAALPSFDGTMLKVFLTRHDPSGIFVLAGSGSPEEGEALTEKLCGRILDLLASDFEYVVIDTAAGLDERALAAIDHATDCVLLASMDVASIRNLAKEITALDRAGMTDARRHFILNRADTRVGLEQADVETAIGMQVDAALPSSRLVPLAMNRGRVVVLEDPESPVALHLRAFTQRFTPPKDDSDVTEVRKSRFMLRRR